MIKFVFTALTAMLLAGCQTSLRKPASLTPETQAQAIGVYELQNSVNRLEDYEDQLKKSKSEDDQKLIDVENKVATLQKNLDDAEGALTKNAISSNQPTVNKLDYVAPWRFQAEEFELSDIKDYSYQGDKPTRTYYLATENTHAYQLQLKQVMTDKKTRLIGELSCDQPFVFGQNGKRENYLSGQVVSFWWPSEQVKPKLAVGITNQESHCVLKFRSEQSSQWSGVNLAPEVEQFKDLRFLNYRFELCSLPKTSNYTGVEKFFLTSNFSAMTCPEQAPIKMLGKPIEGLTERIRFLTGSELPQKAIDDRDPFVDLDFSKAPKLDVIIVSSLLFRSDFYGQLLGRALVWHAQHGAIVRILNSKILELKKDHLMLRKMMAASDNIKVQSYRFISDTGGLGGKIKEIHRVSHTKLFATYSRSEEASNIVIVGGRNIAETYILPAAADHFGFPQLVDYLNGEDSYLFYRDLEAVIQSRAFAESVVSHFFTYWQREPNNFMRGFSLNLRGTKEVDPNYFASQTPLLRHLISLPYKDDLELMDVYAELIDSAQREIKITTPYFFPTKKVGKALERAVKRGVSVTVITKLNLKGDNPDVDFISTAANKLSVNKYWEKFHIYDYKVPKSILHSKLVLVDGKLSVIGSVNLNRRSFYHDVENATIVYSPAFNAQLNSYYSEFLSLSEPVQGDQRVGFFKRLIVGIVNHEL